jgi:hypothetical protein
MALGGRYQALVADHRQRRPECAVRHVVGDVPYVLRVMGARLSTPKNRTWQAEAWSTEAMTERTDLARRVVAAVGQAGAAELLDVLIRSEADCAALIGRLSQGADAEWIAEILIDLQEDEPAAAVGRWPCGQLDKLAAWGGAIRSGARRGDLRSGTFVVASSANTPDVYIMCRGVGRQARVSLHQSGSWRFSIEPISAETGEVMPPIGGETWTRPPPFVDGLAKVFGVIVPSAGVTRPIDDDDNRVSLVQVPRECWGIQFTLILSDPGTPARSWPGADGMERRSSVVPSSPQGRHSGSSPTRSLRLLRWTRRPKPAGSFRVRTRTPRRKLSNPGRFGGLPSW